MTAVVYGGSRISDIDRQVGSPSGFSWKDVRYGDVLKVVRGDTLLDLALRNRASAVFKERIRAMGGNARTLRKQDAWEREQACRQAELNSTEGVLLILPPGQVAAYLREKERAVSAASKAAASSALAAALGRKENAPYEAALERNAAIVAPSWQKRRTCLSWSSLLRLRCFLDC